MQLLKLLALFTILAAPAIAQEVEDEKEFSYDQESEVGPAHWGRLHREWVACANGKMQSPIDLSNKRVKVVKQLGDIRRTYRPSSAVMQNRGHDIMVKWEEGAGGMWINGTEYTLKQLHYHSPSEHTLNGHKFALELHMVHENADKKIAVVGILYKIGRPDSFLAKMGLHLHEVEGEEGEEVRMGMVDPRKVKKGSRKYYRYMGSLTTPPCTEGVIWTILGKVRTVSKEQVNQLREAVHDESESNARPRQPIHHRMISFYGSRKLPRID